MAGIGVIINPHSREHRRNPSRRFKMGFIVGDKGSCHATESLDDVRKLAREFKERDVEILGISGGDGTNHVTLTIFLEEYGDKPLPKIALLRGGTMNNLASELQIKGSTEKILSNLILKYHAGEELPVDEVDMLQVNGKYGFLFGCGLITKFIDRYYSDGNVEPSPRKGLYLLVRAGFSALVNGRFSRELCARWDAQITVDGKKAPFKNYSMLFGGTMKTLGFCFRPLYRAHDNPGQFQIVGISSTPRQLLFSFPQAMLGRPSGTDTYYDEVGKSAVIEFEHPQRYTVDGDFPEGSTSRLEVKVGPRLNFIVPTPIIRKPVAPTK